VTQKYARYFWLKSKLAVFLFNIRRDPVSGCLLSPHIDLPLLNSSAQKAFQINSILELFQSGIMGITTEIPKTVPWNGRQVPVYPMQTVDFSQLLSQEPAEIEKLVRCCQTEGFFYVDLQGIDGRRMLDDQQETLKLMHRFFESPLEVKNEYGLVSPHLGYEPVGSRTGVLENTKDGYEMIKVGFLRILYERQVNSGN